MTSWSQRVIEAAGFPHSTARDLAEEWIHNDLAYHCAFDHYNVMEATWPDLDDALPSVESMASDLYLSLWALWNGLVPKVQGVELPPLDAYASLWFLGGAIGFDERGTLQVWPR